MSTIALAFDLFSLKTSTASGAYIRTANPELDGVHGEDSEYRGLTAPSIAPSSAPSYQTSFRSPNTPDERSLGFPSTPRSAGFEKDAESSHLAPTHMQRARYYASPQLSPGLDEEGDVTELDYMAPSSNLA